MLLRGSVERRAGVRAPFVAAVREEAPDGPRLALALDLSCDGMQLKRVGDEPAAPLRLVFELPDGGGLVEADAELVFEREVGEGPGGRRRVAGVRFVAIRDEDAARIERFVSDAAGRRVAGGATER